MHNIKVGWDHATQAWIASCQLCGANSAFADQNNANYWAQNHVAQMGGTGYIDFGNPSATSATATTTAVNTALPAPNQFGLEILNVLLRIEQKLMKYEPKEDVGLGDYVRDLAEAVAELSARVDDLAHKD